MICGVGVATSVVLVDPVLVHPVANIIAIQIKKRNISVIFFIVFLIISLYLNHLLFVSTNTVECQRFCLKIVTVFMSAFKNPCKVYEG